MPPPTMYGALGGEGDGDGYYGAVNVREMPQYETVNDHVRMVGDSIYEAVGSDAHQGGYVEPVTGTNPGYYDSVDKLKSSWPWFKPLMTRKAAESFLREQGNLAGSFVVRYTEKRGGRYVVTHVANNQTQHALVNMAQGGRLTLDGKQVFKTIELLIEHYQIHPLGGCALRMMAQSTTQVTYSEASAASQMRKVAGRAPAPAKPPLALDNESLYDNMVPIVKKGNPIYQNTDGPDSLYENTKPGAEAPAIPSRSSKPQADSLYGPRSSRGSSDLQTQLDAMPDVKSEDLKKISHETEFGFSDDEEEDEEDAALAAMKAQGAAQLAQLAAAWTPEEYDTSAGEMTGNESWMLTFTGIDDDLIEDDGDF